MGFWNIFLFLKKIIELKMKKMQVLTIVMDLFTDVCVKCFLPWQYKNKQIDPVPGLKVR